MNVSKLEVGKIYKNYKELCSELGLEHKKSTNSKNAQFKELARYCEFSRSGHSFIVNKVYSEPLPKVENRGKSEGSRNNNNKYGEMVELLILDLLATAKGNNVSISRSKLLRTINMINNNYGFGSENIRKLAKHTDVEEQIVYDFYNTNNSNFKKTVERALNNLMDKRIIWYNIVTKVSVDNIHRLATYKEKQDIATIEKRVLKDLGFKRVNQIRPTNYWIPFKKHVTELLKKNTNIDYYYFAYDITINKEFIEEERLDLAQYILKDYRREEEKGELNSRVYFNVIKNAEIRQQDTKKTHKMYEYRMTETYVKDIETLAKILIDDSQEDITEIIKSIQLDNVRDERLSKLKEWNIFSVQSNRK